MIYTEYDPLESVIVGDTYDPDQVSQLLNHPNPSKFNRILEETKQDLDRLAQFLKQGNIEVMRPDVYQYYDPVNMPEFDVQFPIAPIVPRDALLVMGRTILQTYTSYTDRYFDAISYYKIFESMFQQGYRWISQPAPMLENLNTEDDWFVNDRTYKDRLMDRVLWHTATMFKAGDAIIVNHEGPGSASGLEWCRRELPEYRFVNNTASRCKGFGHIDHGFIMIDDDTVIHAGMEWVPECLHTKQLIDVSDCLPELKMDRFVQDYAEAKNRMDIDWVNKYLDNWRGYNQEVCFDLNVLIIDRHNIVFARHIPKLFAKLKSLHIDCHVVPQRHYLFWDGGIHCSTLDVKRKGAKRKII
jgi:glycine amidinotransferase